VLPVAILGLGPLSRAQSLFRHPFPFREGKHCSADVSESLWSISPPMGERFFAARVVRWSRTSRSCVRRGPRRRVFFVCPPPLPFLVPRTVSARVFLAGGFVFSSGSGRFRRLAGQPRIPRAPRPAACPAEALWKTIIAHPPTPTHLIRAWVGAALGPPAGDHPPPPLPPPPLLKYSSC